jgi:hypothetical protein
MIVNSLLPRGRKLFSLFSISPHLYSVILTSFPNKLYYFIVEKKERKFQCSCQYLGKSQQMLAINLQ